ncbi:MAG: anthranilate phosphoribosyltransferase [Dehalococcoidales bacterium]|nr:anthranilate phosphoribosyltransferase [Dehalococcoidales bacterium]
MIKEAIGLLIDGRSLSIDEAAAVMEEIMEAKATSAQLAAFLTALRIKGETADELTGMARVMRSRAIQVRTDGPVLDVVGTGGDGLNTFNISTAAAFVAAGGDVRIAKHGNRAASSRCGSADVLEALGVNIDLDARQVESCIRQAGIGFMFAPNFHPAMKYAAPTRREIGIRTVFNVLGPLTNPGQAGNMVIGVASHDLVEKMAQVLLNLGTQHALVVHGMDGMDELSISGESEYCEIKDGFTRISRRRISPEEMGLKRAPLESIRGDSADINASTIRQVLSGGGGAGRDAVVLNAAAALLAGDRVDSLKEGVALAQEIIDGGRAMSKLKSMIEITHKLKETGDDSGRDSR